MFDTAKCFEIIDEGAEALGLDPTDYTTTKSRLLEDGLTFTVWFYDSNDNLIGDYSTSTPP